MMVGINPPASAGNSLPATSVANTSSTAIIPRRACHSTCPESKLFHVRVLRVVERVYLGSSQPRPILPQGMEPDNESRSLAINWKFTRKKPTRLQEEQI